VHHLRRDGWPRGDDAVPPRSAGMCNANYIPFSSKSVEVITISQCYTSESIKLLPTLRLGRIQNGKSTTSLADGRDSAVQDMDITMTASTDQQWWQFADQWTSYITIIEVWQCEVQQWLLLGLDQWVWEG
jgi:hypothetical protein